VKCSLFGFKTSTEYEYEYYSGLENHANTNTNIFGFEKSSEYEYEYYSVSKYLPNTNANITIRSQLFEYIRIPNYSLTSVSQSKEIEVRNSKVFLFLDDQNGLFLFVVIFVFVFVFAVIFVR